MSTGQRITILRNARGPRAPVVRLARLLTDDGAQVETCDTLDFESGVRLAREHALAGVTALVAAGGDGTLLSALAGAMEADVPVAALPLGTANDLAVHLGVHSADDVAAAILRRSKKRIDVVSCTYVDPSGATRTLPFVTTAGVGVLGDVSKRERSGAAGFIKRVFGNAAWPVLFGTSWRRTRESRTQIELGDQFIDEVVSIFEVCKVPAPGGFALAPGASIDSGILHAFYFGELSTATFLFETLRAVAFDGAHLRSKHVQYISTDPTTNRAGAASVRRVHIAPREPMPVHVQGEYVGTTPATFEITGQSVEVFVPQAAPTFVTMPSWRPTSAGV